MKFLIQTLWIAYFYAIGLGTSMLIGGVIPGSILGMVFLFTALALGWVKEHQVEGVAGWLIKYMILFFLPAAVGVMVVWEAISSNFWAIVLSAAISTVLVIITVGLLQQKLGKKK
ncbi:Antiholin-like protein LrgA [Mucinivorans hirudinis]|uniref:Antiholin-like protein LrgA n=1 Tax=Mucinivorans hirudinis TaxID=1433126 RepID=A0A060R988_9BACT|nr:Antiholin-like protein LrgA [Mucinivorans hirudinis]